MLSVNEVRRICRIQPHRFKPRMPLEHRFRPLPYSAQLPLFRKFVAVCCHGDGVPILIPDIGALEVDEELAWPFTVVEGSESGGLFSTPSFTTWLGEVSSQLNAFHCRIVRRQGGIW